MVEVQNKKKGLFFYVMVLGQYGCILALLFTCFYIYSQAEVLKTSPCDVCEEKLGMMCVPVQKYVTDPGIENAWYDGIELDVEEFK